MAVGFERDNREKPETNYDSYKGTWVLVGDGDISSGQVTEVYPNRIVLMPYYAINPQGNRLVHEIVKEGLPCIVPINERTRIRPTSEQNTILYCNYMNRQAQRDLFTKELEFAVKTRGIYLDEDHSDGSGI